MKTKRYVKEYANDISKKMNSNTVISYDLLNRYNFDLYRIYSLYVHGLCNEHETITKINSLYASFLYNTK